MYSIDSLCCLKVKLISNLTHIDIDKTICSYYDTKISTNVDIHSKFIFPTSSNF